jgi:hypothetical protein
MNQLYMTGRAPSGFTESTYIVDRPKPFLFDIPGETEMQDYGDVFMSSDFFISIVTWYMSIMMWPSDAYAYMWSIPEKLIMLYARFIEWLNYS